jgi:16S rRNA G527 N7-methylase RsmG
LDYLWIIVSFLLYFGGFICCFWYMDFGKWGELIEVFLAKNSQINLSAIRDIEGVYVKHVLDSLELLKIFSFAEGQRVCDLGTG